MSRGGSSLMSGAILIDGGDVVVIVDRGRRWRVLIEDSCWLEQACLGKERWCAPSDFGRLFRGPSMNCSFEVWLSDYLR